MDSSTGTARVKWSFRDGADRDVEVEAIDSLLARERANHQLCCLLVPAFSDGLIARYSRVRPEGFGRVLEALAVELRQEPPFELCDEVARFYAAVFRSAGPAELRVRALVLLFELGAAQERYAVADVARAVLWTVRGEEELALVVEAIGLCADAAWYAHRHTLRGPVPGAVRAALEGARVRRG